MSFTGGPMESVSIAGRNFAGAGDADVNMKLGGFENETQMNGNFTGRQIKTPVPASLSGMSLSIDPDKDDQEFLQEIADGNEFVPTTITFANGSVYSGTLQVSGELQFASQTATAPLDMTGPGKMVKQ
jgi:hypothetical protein